MGFSKLYKLDFPAFLSANRFAFAVLFGLVIPLATSASTWSEGPKTLLYIRVDYEDLKGDPLSEAEASQTMNKVASYFDEVSYGKFSIKTTVTPTFRMPRTAEWYAAATGAEQITLDAHAAAKLAGFDVDKFDLEILARKTPKGGDSGIGIVHGKGLWLYNNFRFGVCVHELGHNLGLPHTHLWKTWDDSVIGSGDRIDFGDAYDAMGGGGDDPRSHFSIRSKSLLGWLGSDGIINVTNGGIYRIYAQDMPGAQSARGLRIARDATNIYWIEFRQKFPENPFMMNGARILRNYSDNNELDLLDMTPNSPLDSKDAPLLLGRTFSDYEAGIHLTPLRKGNTSPESLDVLVQFGRFTGNHPPTLQLSSSAQIIAPGESVTLRAVADDPDKDSLQYSWDFGDGSFDWGKPTVSHNWKESDREFAVRCSVTDTKGGTANKAVVVSIGKPKLSRLYGLVTYNGKALDGARVETDSTNSVLTDSDGMFSLLGLNSGEHRVAAHKNGYWIIPNHFMCPHPEKIELEAIPLGRESIVSKEGIVLEEGDRLSTPASFRPPVDISIVAKADTNNLRMAYAADQIIFNWEVNRTELRVDGGPAGGHHKPGAGQIPPNQYVSVRWIVTPKRQAIYVNNQLRFAHAGDYSRIDRPVSVFTSHSSVTVKSITVKHLPKDTQ